jgi:hypothetical protein
LILPDDIHIDAKLKKRLDTYLGRGGHLLLSGKSGLDDDGKFLFDVGAECKGLSPFRPDYVRLDESVRPDCVKSPMVMYLPGYRNKVKDGKSLGDVHDTYFNRTDYQHFCSHQHTPYRLEASGFAAGVMKGGVMYLAHPVFSIYRGWGCVPVAEYLRKAVRLILGESSIETNMPSTARLNLMNQAENKRYVLHLLYANTVARGGNINVDGVTSRGMIEVIEDLNPLVDVQVAVKTPKEVKSITLEPQGTPLPFEKDEQGRVVIKIDRFTCHQMVVMNY